MSWPIGPSSLTQSRGVCRLLIRHKLQKSLQHIQIMKQQVYSATEWLARTYGLPHADVMQCGSSPFIKCS